MRKLETFRGTQIYVDASVFLFVSLAHPLHARSSADFFARARADKFSLLTSSLTLDEVLCTMLLDRLEREYGVSRSKAQYLRGHPEIVRQLSPSVIPAMEQVSVLAKVEPVLAEDVLEMGKLVAAHGLLPRDAIHLAVMKRLGLTAIATDDTDFERVPDIQVYAP